MGARWEWHAKCANGHVFSGFSGGSDGYCSCGGRVTEEYQCDYGTEWGYNNKPCPLCPGYVPPVIHGCPSCGASHEVKHITTHTPKPWTTTHSPTGEWLITSTHDPEGLDDDVALVYGGNDAVPAVARANAHLIVRAPRMADALRTALPALVAYSNSGHMKKEFMDKDGYSVPARVVAAILAELDGETPS
jgi:hypothetical protein